MATSAEKKPGLLKKIRRTFIAGLLAALPLALTLAAIVWLAELIHRLLGPGSAFGKLLESFGLQFFTSEMAAYLTGVLVTLAMVYLLGAFVEAGMKSRWQALIDNTLKRVPLVGTVYNTLNKVIRMFDLQEQSEIKSMSVVTCHFGGKEKGTVVLALLTSPDPISLNGLDYYAIMIPTAPVPFGGAILYIPVEWVEPSDFGFDGLLNIYMSMGVSSPDYLHKKPRDNSSAT